MADIPDLNDDPDEPPEVYEAPTPKRSRSNDSDDLNDYVNVTLKSNKQRAKAKSPLGVIEAAQGGASAQDVGLG